MKELGYPYTANLQDLDIDWNEALFGVLHLNNVSVEGGRGYGAVYLEMSLNDIFANSPDPEFQAGSLAEAMQWDHDHLACEQSVPGLLEVQALEEAILAAALGVPEQVFEDPRLAKTNAAWAICMDASGYSFATPLEAYESIRSHLLAAADASGHLHGQEDTEAEFEDWFADYRHSLIDILSLEVEIAEHDLACREEVKAQYAEIAVEIEREQAAKYREQMERLLEIVEAG